MQAAPRRANGRLLPATLVTCCLFLLAGGQNACDASLSGSAFVSLQFSSLQKSSAPQGFRRQTSTFVPARVGLTSRGNEFRSVSPHHLEMRSYAARIPETVVDLAALLSHLFLSPPHAPCPRATSPPAICPAHASANTVHMICAGELLQSERLAQQRLLLFRTHAGLRGGGGGCGGRRHGARVEGLSAALMRKVRCDIISACRQPVTCAAFDVLNDRIPAAWKFALERILAWKDVN